MSDQTFEIPMSEAEAAKLLGVSLVRLRAWRYEGVGPTYRRIGSRARYLESDLKTFRDAKTVHAKESTS